MTLEYRRETKGWYANDRLTLWRGYSGWHYTALDGGTRLLGLPSGVRDSDAIAKFRAIRWRETRQQTGVA